MYIRPTRFGVPFLLGEWGTGIEGLRKFIQIYNNNAATDTRTEKTDDINETIQRIFFWKWHKQLASIVRLFDQSQ